MARRVKGPTDEEISLARIEALRTNGRLITARIIELQNLAIDSSAVQKRKEELEFLLNELKKIGPDHDNRKAVKERLDDLTGKIGQIRIFCDNEFEKLGETK